MKTFFVSSTFKDMQAERDVLHQVVFPALRNHLKAYGEEVDELDLRWGVDTSLMSEEESGRFVVETCLYALLNSGVQNRLAVQKAIDMTQAAQSGKDNDLMYYMYSVLRELGNEASIEEVEEHIRKRQEENLP